MTHPLPNWWNVNADLIKEIIIQQHGYGHPLGARIRSAVERGRFLRAATALELARVLGVLDDEESGSVLMHLLADVELMHSAACILDDVIDGDDTRRGVPSFMVREGKPASILVPMKMFSLAISDEMSRVPKGSCELPRALSRMVDGEAFDTIGALASTDAESQVRRVMEKTTPLFGAAFAHVAGVAQRGQGINRRDFRRFGESLGVLYQTANDVHDVFSIGPLARGSGDESVRVTFSLPFALAAQRNLVSFRKLGEVVSRNEMQDMIEGWRNYEVDIESLGRLESARKGVIRDFPGKIPPRFEETIALVTDRNFWEYRYES